jgi:hypothetical protein
MRTLRRARYGDKSLRIAHAPSVVGGNSTTLSAALNQLGIPSLVVAYEDHRFGYKPDVVLWDKKSNILRRELIRVISTFRLALGYEVIHFNFGTTMAMPSMPVSKSQSTWTKFIGREIHYYFSELLQWAEIILLSILKRRIVITFQGDDARQGDISTKLFDESIALHVGRDYYSSRTDRIKRRRIKRLARISHQIYYVNPDLSHFLPSSAKFVPYCHTPVKNMAPKSQQTRPSCIQIVHAPSHRAAKGTNQIIAAIALLQREGINVELSLIENVQHSDIGDLLLSADLLIDQIFAGWYGGVAVEALCRGTPVMAYIREDDLVAIPKKMREELPILRVTAETLADEIKRFLLLSNEDLRKLIDTGVSFAVNWHDPEVVAKFYINSYFS